MSGPDVVYLIAYEPPDPPSPREAAALIAALRDRLDADRVESLASFQLSKVASRYDFERLDAALVMAINVLDGGGS